MAYEKILLGRKLALVVLRLVEQVLRWNGRMERSRGIDHENDGNAEDYLLWMIDTWNCLLKRPVKNVSFDRSVFAFCSGMGYRVTLISREIEKDATAFFYMMALEYPQ